MYVVLEFNQASGMPHVYDTDICDTEVEAVKVMEAAEESTRKVGRRESYEVFELVRIDR